MSGRLGARPLNAKLLAGVADDCFFNYVFAVINDDHHFNIILTAFLAVGRLRCWVGSGLMSPRRAMAGCSSFTLSALS